MAMLTKSLIVICVCMILGVGGAMLESCTKACDPAPVNASIKVLQATNKRINSISGNDVDVPSGSVSKVRFDSLAIELKHTVQMSKVSTTPGIFTSAFADCGLSVTYQMLNDIIISSSSTFDAAHPSSSNLKDIVQFHPDYTYPGSTAGDVIGQLPIGEVPILLTFTVPPAENGAHQFTIRYALNDGSVVQGTTATVFITK